MKIFCRTLLTAFLLVFTACRAREIARSESPIAQYEVLARQKYGAGVEYVFNSSKTAILCVKKSKPTQLYPQQQVSFFVYDITDRRILFEDEIPNGSVGWKDEYSALVEVVPGTEKGEENSPRRHGYLFDLRTRKTRDLENTPVQ